MTLPPDEALRRLEEGHARWVSGAPRPPAREPREIAENPRPFAAILGCADPRVPPEILFDQQAGDLFVVRVAGNAAVPAAIGSMEFAALAFGVRLLVVLGHTRCGAVQSAAERLARGAPAPSGALEPVLDFIHQSLAALREEAPGLAGDALVRRAIRRNVRASRRALEASAALAPLVREGRVRVTGAEYDVDTGRVQFLAEGGGAPEGPAGN